MRDADDSHSAKGQQLDVSADAGASVTQVVPQDSGGAGGQAPPSASAAITPIDKTHLGAALRSVEGRSSMMFGVAVAAFRDAEASRELLRERFEVISTERDSFRERFHEADKANAVLRDRIRSDARFRSLQKGVFTLGTLMAGGGIGSAVNANALRGPEVAFILIGFIAMLLGSPFLFPRGEE